MSIVVAGIDLGGATAGTTATAIVGGEPGGRPHAHLLDHDAEGKRMPRTPEVGRLVRALRSQDVALVAIDAPLSLPHPVVCEDDGCVRCFPENGCDADYTSRSCDGLVAWVVAGYVSAHPMPAAMLGALTFRGTYLRRALERAGIQVVETWPRGVHMALAGSRVDRLPGSSSEPDAYVARAAALLAQRVAIRSPVATPADVDAMAAGLAAWGHATTAVQTHVGDDEGICICGVASPKAAMSRGGRTDRGR